MKSEKVKCMGAFYFLLALVINLVITPIGILYGLLTFCRATNWKLTALAECMDRAGNVLCRELFNDLLLSRNSKHLFGDGRETISSVIGRNVLAGTLSATGKWINRILERLQKNHAVDNIGY